MSSKENANDIHFSRLKASKSISSTKGIPKNFDSRLLNWTKSSSSENRHHFSHLIFYIRAQIPIKGLDSQPSAYQIKFISNFTPQLSSLLWRREMIYLRMSSPQYAIVLFLCVTRFNISNFLLLSISCRVHLKFEGCSGVSISFIVKAKNGHLH